MRNISGHVVSTKPITLSRAAKLISRFAAVDNGSSPAVSVYLERAADAFNQLVQFHNKRSKTRSIDNNSPDQTNVGKLQTNIGLEKSLGENKGKDSENRVKESDKKINDKLGKTKVDKDSEIPLKKKKRKKDEAELKEEKSSKKKKSRDEGLDS